MKFLKDGIAQCMHKAFTAKHPQEFQSIDTNSFSDFAHCIARLLKVDATVAIDEDIDVEPEDPDPTVPGESKKTMAISLAKLAQQLPPNEASTLIAETPSLIEDFPEEVLFHGEEKEEVLEDENLQVTIHKLVAKFVNPKSLQDVVEAAIQLSSVAMYYQFRFVIINSCWEGFML